MKRIYPNSGSSRSNPFKRLVSLVLCLQLLVLPAATLNEDLHGLLHGDCDHSGADHHGDHSGTGDPLHLCSINLFNTGFDNPSLEIVVARVEGWSGSVPGSVEAGFLFQASAPCWPRAPPLFS